MAEYFGPLLDQLAVVRQNFDAFLDRDFDAAIALVDEEWVYAPGPNAATPGVLFRGHEGWHTLLDVEGWRDSEIKLDVEMSRVDRYVMASGYVDFTTPDGERRANPTASLHVIRDGKVWLSRGFADEREALGAVSFSEHQELTLAFEAAPDAMALFDDDGRLVHGNRATAALLGLPQRGLRGIRIDRFAPPEERDRAMNAWEGWKRRGQSAGLAPLLAADGTRKLVALTVKTNYTAGRHLVVARRRDADDLGGARTAVLTPRQREVLGMLASGLNGPEAAERLFLSPATIRTHVQNAMQALGARTRAEAVAKALTAGELDPAELGTQRPGDRLGEA
jgi:PAS domain S-box-containing protein